LSKTGQFEAKRISIIIPSLNSKLIDQTLEALLQQAYDLSKVEILVVGLDKYNLVVENEIVRFVSTGEPVSAGKARNIGFAHASGEIICFTDDDCVPDPDWLENLLKPLQAAELFAVGGAMPLPENGYWAKCDAITSAYEHLAFQPAGPRKQLPSLNLGIRRQTLQEMNGFSEDFPGASCEDAHLSARMRRAGYTLWFTPEAVIHHVGWRKTFKTILGHAYLFGQNSVWIQEDLQDFIKPPLFFRHWLLMLLFTPLVAAWISARMYLRNKQMRSYWTLFPGIFITQIAWGLGVVHTLLRKRRKAGGHGG
jgi:GT2 family glycosyltransferase